MNCLLFSLFSPFTPFTLFTLFSLLPLLTLLTLFTLLPTLPVWTLLILFTLLIYCLNSVYSYIFLYYYSAMGIGLYGFMGFKNKMLECMEWVMCDTF